MDAFDVVMFVSGSAKTAESGVVHHHRGQRRFGFIRYHLDEGRIACADTKAAGAIPFERPGGNADSLHGPQSGGIHGDGLTTICE